MNRVYRLSIFASLLILVSSGVHALGGDPTGKWKGQWYSQSTGHRGPMRANVTQASDGSYQARFSGRFALIIPFTYKVTLQPSYDANGNVHLHASKPLGPLMGSYTMDAMSTGGTLNGSFRAAKDNGTIRMHRVR